MLRNLLFPNYSDPKRDFWHAWGEHYPFVYIPFAFSWALALSNGHLKLGTGYLALGSWLWELGPGHWALNTNHIIITKNI